MDLTVPAALHPASSLLGRLVRRWSDDERQAESRYIVAAALVLGGATLAGQWAWVVWGTEGEMALGFFAAQVVGGLFVGGFTLLGWRPALHIRADDQRLTVQRGAETLDLPYEAVTSVERITAAAYHGHWRRYAATFAFVNRLPADLLLLTTARGPVVLGLPAGDLARLEAHLAGQVPPDVERRLVRAA